MDWNLFGCAQRGHATYAPDESELRDRLRTGTPAGEAWRCLRCGSFVAGTTPGHGPAADAPLIKRGKELRSELILRVFAVERLLRFLVLGAAAYGIWRFREDRAGVQRAFNNLMPALQSLYKDLGFDINHSKLIGLVNDSFKLSPRFLMWLAIGVGAYALIEMVESIGLWLGRRWGEYFAMIATSVFLPYEIYDLTAKVTWLRLGALFINVLLVAYLIWSRRLLKVRGGKQAYEASLREAAIIEVEQKALDSAAPSQPAQTSPAHIPPADPISADPISADPSRSAAPRSATQTCDQAETGETR
jgi:uncharacterized membrane protein (DUF2068 family)